MTPDRLDQIKRAHQDASVPESTLRTWLSEILAAIDEMDVAAVRAIRAEESAVRELEAEVRQLTEDRDRARVELETMTASRDLWRSDVKDAEAAQAAAEAKLHKVALLKLWTNEDGKKFVFADDLYAAVEGGEG